MFECGHEVIVFFMRVAVAAGVRLRLVLESLRLIHRVHQLRVRVDDLPSADDQLEAVGHLRILVVAARERGEFDRMLDDERRLHDRRTTHLLVELVDQVAAAKSVHRHIKAHVFSLHEAKKRLCRVGLFDVDAARVQDRLADGEARPRRRKIYLDQFSVAVRDLDACRAREFFHERAEHLFGELHVLFVIPVRAVMLDHREVLQVARVESFVAEDARDFKHPVEPADEALLQERFRCDAHVHVQVVGGVMRFERSRERAGRGVHQYRRLHLQKAARPVEFPRKPHEVTPQYEAVKRLPVAHQVQIPLAPCGLLIRDAVPFFRWLAQRL